MPHIDGLVQNCTNYIANELALLRSCTKPLIWDFRQNSIIVLPFRHLFDINDL